LSSPCSEEYRRDRMPAQRFSTARIVREAKPFTEGERLLALLNRQFDTWGDGTQFEWLYQRNPLGPSRCWTLETEADSIAGFSAAFPRKLRFGYGTLDAWVLGDFWIAKEQRSLGPAIALQRAACEGVDRREVDLWYDFPSTSMLAVYRRMGLRVAGEMGRWVLPLRADHLVAERIGRHPLGRGISAVGNAMLRWRDALRRRDPSLEVGVFEGPLPACTDAGIERDPVPGVTLERTADYLRWRYREDPRGGITILGARRNGAVCGFLALKTGDTKHTIVDAFGIRGPGVLRELVLYAIEMARERSASALTVGLSNRHPFEETFQGLGFRRRDGAPFVCYARAGLFDEHTRWFLMNGDRDF
jgi:hypothetical protein